jgi:isopentenyl-diphosphate Delta-isomerase
MSEQVILVDTNDVEIGVAEKMEAHQKALLHRAFSVFIFNDAGEMLIHQRALSKYHSGGLWTNACCGHPRPNEKTLDAAKRRLMEEMGINCELEHKFAFTYKVALDNHLTEHEVDHVFIGKFNGPVAANSLEVQDYKWLSIEDVKHALSQNADSFTEWFKICLSEVLSKTDHR